MTQAAKIKQCETCKVDFLYKSAKALYCSKYCNHLAYRKRNPQKVRDRKNKWYAKDKDVRAQYRLKMSDYHRQYWLKRRSTDTNFKLKNTLRNRLNIAIKGDQKTGSAVRDLGCSIEFFKNYFESKFTEGMTWANHGEWHIDHIEPLSGFNLEKREELLKACHYSNLQPLWAEDNLSKGGVR